MGLRVSGFVSAAVVACAGLLSAVPAAAQGTWTLGTGTGANCNPSTNPIASITCTVGSVSSTFTTWGNFGASSWSQGTIGDFDASGFGAYTGRNETSGGTTSGQHAFDSYTSGCATTGLSANSSLSAANSGCGGGIEAMLMSFNASVDLTSVKLGWSAGDADYSVYRWTGGASGPMMGTQAVNTSTGALTGWTLVGSNDGDLTNPFTVPGVNYSSYWLITTYFGANATNLDAGNDRFKISEISALKAPTSVSEPGSLALAGLALGGFLLGRRRRAR